MKLDITLAQTTMKMNQAAPPTTSCQGSSSVLYLQSHEYKHKCSLKSLLFFQSRIQGIVCKIQSLQFKEHDNEIKQRIRRQSQHAKVIAYTIQETYRSKNGRNMIAKKLKYSVLFMSFIFFVKLEGVKGFNEWECFSIRVNRSYCRNELCTTCINIFLFKFNL